MKQLLLLMLSGCLSFHAGAIPNAPDDATYLTLRGTRVHYVDEGPRNAPTVVLIHGFASSVGVWTKLREALRDDFRVLALDLKGFGYTDRPEGDYSPEEQARLVLALMDAKSVHSAALVAHSYGSSVALQVALTAPERVERIALYDAWIYAEQLPTTFHWARGRGIGEAIFGAFYDQRSEDKLALAFYDPEIVPQALVDTVEDQLSRPGTRAAALAAVRAMRYEEPQARYGEISQPVLLLWGREDTITPLEYGERLVNQLPDARLRVYPRCGHFPMIEARNPSTRDLVQFLDASEASERNPVPASEASVPVPVPVPADSESEAGTEAESEADSETVSPRAPW